jgi:hypothetical protein
MTTILYGKKLKGGTMVTTINALGEENGSQWLASSEQVEMLKGHIRDYDSPYQDLRKPMRQIEKILLSDEYAGFLVGNQCLDFMKQDGITEIEEAIMANVVEQRLNDLLLRDEAHGKVLINRQAIYVSCVSNFTNFLDLFRKTIRSLEVGIPCVILGRTNTAQHAYRWAELLVQLCVQHGIDPGMITFLSCSLEDIKDIIKSCENYTGNLYTTSSREMAAEIMKSYPKVVASTGGPNTMVATELTDAVKNAIQISATIESSGQCTALRHCVVPKTAHDGELMSIFDKTQQLETGTEAVEKSVFAGIFAQPKGTQPPSIGYNVHNEVDAYIKIENTLPQPGINEFWRKVVVDFSKLDIEDDANLDCVASWLNENQPISLAVNGPRKDSIALLLRLFERTGMVVNTVGSCDNPEMPPALTCQARPQEAEIFGEFPPRSDLKNYTKFPVVVPSSNPSYDATYSLDYLKGLKMDEFYTESVKMLLAQINDPYVQGYCFTVIGYIRDATQVNPKEGFGTSRTALWGLQRPPVQSKTFLICSSTTLWDDVAPIVIMFYATNARDQVGLVIDPDNTGLISLCKDHEIAYYLPDDKAVSEGNVYNRVVISEPMKTFPMAGNFVSCYFPLGHIKVSIGFPLLRC